MHRSDYKESDPNIKQVNDVRELLMRHPSFDIVHPYQMRQFLPNCDAGFAEYTALQKGFYFLDDPEVENHFRVASIVFGADCVASFWLALGSSSLNQSHLEPNVWVPDLMRNVAFYVTRYHWASDRCRPQDRQGWRDILKQCVQLNAHLSSIKYRESLCVGLIRHCLRDWKDSLSDLITNATIIVQAWTSELKLAGANLTEYGELEHDILIKSTAPYEAMNWTWSAEPKVWRTRCRIISFAYGPDTKDWSISLSWPFDEWAGQFWNSVENPELLMPGSWVDDDGLCIRDGEYVEQRGYLSTVLEYRNANLQGIP